MNSIYRVPVSDVFNNQKFYWHGRLYQKIGRSLHSDNVPNVYDFFDHTHYMLKAQSKARIRALESEEFVVEQGIPTECMYEIPDRTV